MGKLTPDEDGWVDDKGAFWATPEQWLFVGVLGGCGCGSSEEFSERAVDLLKHFGTPHDERSLKEFFHGDQADFWELMAHWLDSKDLLEHGGSIYGSWLTEKGEECLKTINEAQGGRDGT